MQLPLSVILLSVLMRTAVYAQASLDITVSASPCETNFNQYSTDSESITSFVRTSIRVLPKVDAKVSINLGASDPAVQGLSLGDSVEDTTLFSFGQLFKPLAHSIAKAIEAGITDHLSNNQSLEIVKVTVLQDQRVAVEILNDVKSSPNDVLRHFKEDVASRQDLDPVLKTILQESTSEETESGEVIRLNELRKVVIGSFTKGDASDFREGRAFEISWQPTSDTLADNTASRMKELQESGVFSGTMNIEPHGDTIRLTRDESGNVVMHNTGFTISIRKELE